MELELSMSSLAFKGTLSSNIKISQEDGTSTIYNKKGRGEERYCPLITILALTVGRCGQESRPLTTESN
jgi:hypothetical protein